MNKKKGDNCFQCIGGRREIFVQKGHRIEEDGNHCGL